MSGKFTLKIGLLNQIQPGNQHFHGEFLTQAE